MYICADKISKNYHYLSITFYNMFYLVFIYNYLSFINLDLNREKKKRKKQKKM